MRVTAPSLAHREKGVEAPHTGTTIVACQYKDARGGGVVLGCDGRVSVGNYISNRASNKLAPLADHVFLLRSGSAPDAQIVTDHGERSRRLPCACMRATCNLITSTFRSTTLRAQPGGREPAEGQRAVRGKPGHAGESCSDLFHLIGERDNLAHPLYRSP